MLIEALHKMLKGKNRTKRRVAMFTAWLGFLTLLYWTALTVISVLVMIYDALWSAI